MPHEYAVCLSSRLFIVDLSVYYYHCQEIGPWIMQPAISSQPVFNIVVTMNEIVTACIFNAEKLPGGNDSL